MKIFILALCFFCANVSAQSESSETVSVKTPNFSLAYSYYRYALEGTTTANTRIYKFGDSTVDLQLFSVAWLYSSKWTFVMLTPYSKNKVETIYEPVPTGLNFKTTDTTEGLGDVRLIAMSSFNANIMYDVALSLPSGSTDAHFTSSPSQRAAYNMQLGSGTPDFIGGLTYSHNWSKWLSTARGQITWRGGKNDHGYALGNEWFGKLNSGWQFNPNFYLGAQGEYKNRGRIQGRDNKYELFNKYVSPMDVTIRGDGHQYYHSAQVTWITSVVGKAQTPLWRSTSAQFEAGVPLWQDASNLDRIRLDVKYWLSAGLSTSF